ncbi:MAG: Ureidoglycolate lyase [Acidimicrobiales bacterium]|nr:MAG: FAA hydrolase family protein [Actinomycetota bacterium]MBV6507859.1 Ureidoglycolate lyase [Acidimicrobiales bacterium]RIK06005.1 MAG: 5-carboxymethyl-2-hydroxymuconate isomerase [Acidobacteriota bacterium]
MRLARFRHDHRQGLGVVLDDRLVDLADAGLPSDMLDLLEAGPVALDVANEAAERAATAIDLTAVELLAPIPRPPKFLAIGLNYADHVAESGQDPPAVPIFFNKQSTCVIGPGEPVQVPLVSSLVDYEGELGVVIGRRCRHVPADEAMGVVAGYVIVNDVSVRDWQLASPTMTMGKSFDTHGPIGPWLTTRDEIADPHDLHLRTLVNDEVMQDASTEEMIFDIPHQIEHLTAAFTLEPGDVISTGTPAGVGIARQPPVLLKHGDVVRIEIEGLGVLENPVLDEPRPG